MRGSTKHQGLRFGDGRTVRVTSTKSSARNWPTRQVPPPEGQTPRPCGFAR